MNTIIARTVIGGKDLFLGIPSLNEATISSVAAYKTVDDYCTEVTLRLVCGSEMKIVFRQEL